jgi:hypothetical protein
MYNVNSQCWLAHLLPSHNFIAAILYQCCGRNKSKCALLALLAHLPSGKGCSMAGSASSCRPSAVSSPSAHCRAALNNEKPQNIKHGIHTALNFAYCRFLYVELQYLMLRCILLMRAAATSTAATAALLTDSAQRCCLHASVLRNITTC